ncbi:MAG: BrnT family toxin [bacterium]|nr:BrnT family toxin [bacterium]
MDLDFIKLEGFEWDKGNLDHIKKHNIKYEDCEEIFNNKPFLVRKDLGHSQHEERTEAIGKTNAGKKIFLVYTTRKGKIRVVSARNQSKKERIFL